MKKLLLFLLPPLIGSIIIFIAIRILSASAEGKGALQVTSSPKSSVYLNGKFIGKTPFCKCELHELLPTGEYTIRLVAENSIDDPFEAKIPITKSVITVVDRTFIGKTMSYGSVITLNPIVQKDVAKLFITSFPTDATVFLDKKEFGTTPISRESIQVGEHDILLSKDGYKKKMVRIRAVNGYTLSATIFLGVKPDITQLPSLQLTASPSAVATLSATPSIKVSPIVTLAAGQTVRILATPLGFLRVREEANTNSSETAQVKPGESFSYKDQHAGWFQIQLPNGKMGWVSGQYVKKE